MNAFLCPFLKSFIDADRNEKKGLPSPRKLILVNFKVSEVLMKVLVMAGDVHALRSCVRGRAGALWRPLVLTTG